MLASAFPAPQTGGEQKTDWVGIGGLATGVIGAVTGVASIAQLKKQGREHMAALQRERQRLDRRLRRMRNSYSSKHRRLSQVQGQHHQEIGLLHDLAKAEQKTISRLDGDVSKLWQSTRRLDDGLFTVARKTEFLSGETGEIRRAAGLEREALELSDEQGNKYSLASDPELEQCLLSYHQKFFVQGELVRGPFRMRCFRPFTRALLLYDTSALTPPRRSPILASYFVYREEAAIVMLALFGPWCSLFMPYAPELVR
jgi:hypothetical protein